MTVSSILLNFRAALLALIPLVERLGIPWQRPDAYDEWDDIASTLFEKLVVEVFRWSLPEDAQEEFHVPSYDLLLPSYSGMSTVEVVHPSLEPGRWLFHAFGTNKEPLDVIEVRGLSADGKTLAEELATCSVEGAVFCLRIDNARLVEQVDCPMSRPSAPGASREIDAGQVGSGGGAGGSRG